MIRLKSARDIAILRESGAILGKLLHELKNMAGIGVVLSDLDRFAASFLKSKGAKSAFLGYKPSGASRAYPASICTSLNEIVVHGIPNKTALKKGDILKIDIGVDFKGYITDGAGTVLIGEPSLAGSRLLNAAEEALKAGIRAAKPGGHTGDIGAAVEAVSKKNKVQVIKSLTGHGVGFELHEDPTIYNYGEKGKGVKLVPGLVIAIEPMFSESSPYVIKGDNDEYKTADNSLSVHVEHTIAITEDGPEILTKI